MFGFGSGRIGPQEHVIADLEKAVRQGRAVEIPTGKRGGPPPSHFERLRRLPRMEVVGFDEIVRPGNGLMARLSTHVGDLVLPAETFVFELALPPGMSVRHRFFEVDFYGPGKEALILLSSFACLASGSWVFTPPLPVETLGGTEIPREWAYGPGACSRGMLEEMAYEVVVASLGLLVLSDRHTAMISGTRH